MTISYTFSSDLWRYAGEAAWYFVTLPKDVSVEIQELPVHKAGFGSVKVRVSSGSEEWSTSVFPDSSSGCYLLPVKKSVRKALSIDDGDSMNIELSLAEDLDLA